MRVIAGSAKGRRLTVPKGLAVRPTLDRVREALFSTLGDRIEGSRFLDLFAGTGANGIEALSRGARQATFVDNDPRALAAVRANLDHTGFTPGAEVRRLVLPVQLDTLGGQVFDLIYADPPYAFPDYPRLIEGLGTGKLLHVQGCLIIEAAPKTVLPGNLAGLHRYREKRYGDTALNFYCWEEEAVESR